MQFNLAVAAIISGTEGHESMPWYEMTTVWVLLPFLVVVALLWRLGVHKTVTKTLDERAVGIKSELEAARSLREEAQDLLAKYQTRQREAEGEAQGIIDQAKRDAKRMSEEMRQKLDEQLARRVRSAEDKIARAEIQAIAEVRGQTAELAVRAAEEIVRTRVDGQAQGALVDKAISDVRARLV